MPISHHITQQLATERSKDLRAEGARTSRRRSLNPGKLVSASRRATVAAVTTNADVAGAPSSPGTSHGAARGHGEYQLDDLVSAAAAGVESAWDTLFAEFGSAISAVTRLYRLGSADAADVAQITWIRLYEHIDRISEPTRLGAWLATTARRECLRVLRANDRHALYGVDAPDGESQDAVPAESVLTQERDDALWRSFACLDERDQALLGLLVASHQPAYDEISTALDMPVGSIGPTRQRALRRLRGQLESVGDLALMRS
jgi:RNA polymerase sigma factor (sigma-70 family)